MKNIVLVACSAPEMSTGQPSARAAARNDFPVLIGTSVTSAIVVKTPNQNALSQLDTSVFRKPSESSEISSIPPPASKAPI